MPLSCTLPTGASSHFTGCHDRHAAELMLSCRAEVLFVCVESYMSHLVRGALGDTEATRSVCERLLERKISSLQLWEEVPRKIGPMNGDGARMCMCTIGLKCVRVCLYREGGRGSSNSITGIQIYNSNNTCFLCDNIMAVIDSVPLYYINTQLML